MSSERERFAAAAEALVGTPFRFRGRDRKTGLDCVGVVLAALADIGRKPAVLNGYAMRQTHPDRHIDVALACGFELFEGTELEPGDLLLVNPGPAQVHLLVFAGTRGFIHAHAGLGRVVRTPAPCPWSIAIIWRLAAD